MLASLVSFALLCVLWPFLGAIFWSIVLAIVFSPLHRKVLRSMGSRRRWAALATLACIVLGVGIPLVLVSAALLRQATAIFADVKAGRIDLGAYAERISEGLPSWAHKVLDASGLGDVGALRERLSASALDASRVAATHLFGIGVNVFAFALALALTLYLLYVLLDSGSRLVDRIERLSPLQPGETRSLADTFTTVVRATVRGGIVMAACQGTLGGLVLALLGIPASLFWGVVFGVLSMIPAVGAGILWAPIAVYFLATGAVWKGIALIVFGTVILTVLDNVLRPFLIGRDTHLPGYLVLVTTLGGIAVVGPNGVIVGPMLAAMFVAIWELSAADAEHQQLVPARRSRRAGTLRAARS